MCSVGHREPTVPPAPLEGESLDYSLDLLPSRGAGRERSQPPAPDYVLGNPEQAIELVQTSAH